MEVEVNFAANKKRRRSSLFVDRRSRIFDDIEDSQTAPQNEPVASCKNMNVAEIENYISNTKQCYKNWRLYERELKSKLETVRHAKPLQFDEKTLTEFLSVEDRSFLKDAEGSLERHSELNKLLTSATSRFEALVDQYEHNKRLYDVVVDDLSLFHRTTIVKAVDDYREMVKNKLGRLDATSVFPLSHDAPQILLYNSDSE